MAQFKDSEIVQYSRDKKGSFGKAVLVSESWGKFKDRFQPDRILATPEKRFEYDKLPVPEKAKLKAQPGWYCGALLKDGKRRKTNAERRVLMTLDIDDCTLDLFDDILDGYCGLSKWNFLCHSTRSHTSDKPRLRIVLPLSRSVTPDEYLAMVRHTAWLLDPEMYSVSIETFRTVQVMFFPSISIDDRDNYVCFENDGPALDVDDMLDDMEDRYGYWDDFAALPRRPDERKYHERAAKAQDPRDKEGIIGRFCRAHDSMHEFLADYLDDVYFPSDDGDDNRYGRVGSKGAPAAVVYEDLFLYSNHGTDPAEGQLCNVWDLYRIQMFHELDEDADEDTPVGKLPSQLAMIEFAKKDPPTQRLAHDESFDERLRIGAAFDDIDEDNVPERREPRKETGRDKEAESQRGGNRSRPKPRYREDWFDDVETKLAAKGQEVIEPTVHNYVLLLKNDYRTAATIAYNELREMIVVVGDIDPDLVDVPPLTISDKVNGENLGEHHRALFKAILGAEKGQGKRGWGVKPAENDLDAALMLIAKQNSFNPFREKLERSEWDGIKRVPYLFVDYLGEDNTPYARQTAINIMVASVERTFNPGSKFDFMPILMGPQGIRKSTFIQELYGNEFFGEYGDTLDDPKKFVEGTLGKVAIELSELEGMNRATATATKSLLRNTSYTMRLAYRRNPEEIMRRCVIWGTTNAQRILKDPTGNRSFWIQYVSVSEIDTTRLIRERDQIWAEAFYMWQRMKRDPDSGELPLFLSDPDAAAEQVARAKAGMLPVQEQEAAQDFIDWLEQPHLAADVAVWYNVDRKKLVKRAEGFGEDDGWIKRNAFSQADLRKFLTDRSARALQVQSHDTLTRILDIVCERGWIKPTMPTYRYGGVSARWYVREGHTANTQGFTNVDAPDGGEFTNPAL